MEDAPEAECEVQRVAGREEEQRRWVSLGECLDPSHLLTFLLGTAKGGRLKPQTRPAQMVAANPSLKGCVEPDPG